MSDLKKMKADILADGVIDAGEVTALRTVLYADGSVDKEEAEMLFELNDAVSGKNNHSSWNDLFIEAITSYLLEDKNSPGVIDADEAIWLKAKVQGDGELDALERRLLEHLKSKAKEFPASLAGLLN